MGIPLVLAVDYLGGWTFGVLIAVAAAIGTVELLRMERQLDYRPAALIAVPASIVVAVVPLLAPSQSQTAWIGIVMAVMAGTASLYLLLPLYQRGFLNWVFTLLPVWYVGLMLGHLGLLREGRDGAWWIFLVLVITWSYDTGAYFGGRLFGRHPFMQHVSPKKTVEGVAGGLLLSAVAGLATVPAIGITLWQALLLGLSLGIVAQAGDLVESMIKRQTGVKDSGGLIPGHGGLLDRIDSLLFTGVLAYYLAVLLGYA